MVGRRDFDVGGRFRAIMRKFVWRLRSSLVSEMSFGLEMNKQ